MSAIHHIDENARDAWLYGPGLEEGDFLLPTPEPAGDINYFGDHPGNGGLDRSSDDILSSFVAAVSPRPSVSSASPVFALETVGHIYYVDADAENEDADGLSEGNAFQSLAAALEQAQSGDTILLKAGLRYETDTIVASGITISSYVEGAAPIIDARRNLAMVWEKAASGVYKTDIIYRDAPSNNNGPTANSTHHQLWVGFDKLDWAFAGVTIEDNIQSVTTNPGSYTIHQTGSEDPDPRYGSTGDPNFTVYVHLPDGADPNGADLFVADQSLIVSGPINLKDVVLIGGNSKDGIHTAAANEPFEEIPVYKNVTILDVAAHGFVGPLRSEGTLTIQGRGAAGSDLHAYGYNSNGGLINLYTSEEYDEDLTFDVLQLSHGNIAVYGHGSGTLGGGYNSVTINELHVDTVRTALVFDTVGDNRPFVYETTVHGISAKNIASAFRVDGDLFVGGGEIVFADEGKAPNSVRSILTLTGEDQVIVLSGLSWELLKDFNIYSDSHLLVAGDADSLNSATLILDGVHDLSEPLRMAALSRSQGGQPSIVITGGSTIGDLQLLPGNDGYVPTTLIVEAGSTFGLGGRTGPEIEEYLDELGIPYSISSQTTIVARDGTILSEPGWEHFDPSAPPANILGDGSNEVLAGTFGDDLIDGAGGRDYIAGNLGDDILMGGPGDDTLSGGEGDDSLDGGDGDDYLYGGEGNDTLILGPGQDQVFGGAGDDTIIFEFADSATRVDGGAGQDVLRLELTSEQFYADGVAEEISAYQERQKSGDDTETTFSFGLVVSGVEALEVYIDGQRTFVGTPGDDLIELSDEFERAEGLGGNDTIIGNDGDNVLNGGDGNDVLIGDAAAAVSSLDYGLV